MRERRLEHDRRDVGREAGGEELIRLAEIHDGCDLGRLVFGEDV
jgi:hypothetical protein